LELISYWLDEILKRVAQIHATGINMSYLGALISKVSNPKVKWRLTLEMSARAIKCIIRAKLRFKMREIGFVGDEPYRKEVLTYLNLVLGHHPSSEIFWTRITEDCGIGTPSLKYAVVNKFGPTSLNELQMRETYDLRYSIGDLRTLLLRTCEMTGIKLTRRATTELSNKPNSFELLSADLDELGTVVKHLGIVDMASGHVLLMEAKQKAQKKTDTNEVERLLDLAQENLEKAKASGVRSSFMDELAEVKELKAMVSKQSMD